MNFLAHLHLSGDDPGWLLGGILGDFARGRLTPGRFPNRIQLGITLHREIDAFTDSHPTWKSSKARLQPDQRRFAGIVIDVFYDHFLAIHWTRFSNAPFAQWVKGTYAVLKSEVAILAESSNGSVDQLDDASFLINRMADHDWLTSYLDPDEIPMTIDRISHRSPRLVGMRGAGRQLKRHYGQFESDFLAFYPEVVSVAERFRRKNR